MASLNKCTLIGNLGKDPEVRYTQDGKAVTSFSIATTEKWKDKVTGENREKTEWHRIVAFNRVGEICGEYLKKGSSIYAEGKLQTRSWEKDGVTRYTTEIILNQMLMLSTKRTDDYSGSNSYSDNGSQTQPKIDYPDDDIPF